MANYRIAETSHFESKIHGRKYQGLYKKITNYVYPILRENPFFGPNIKKLKGEYRDVYRYRIGKYRLFYKVSEELVLVFVLDIEDRKDAYK
ncbi:MAG: type II toxin-antitoxin system RelE/ParE family toxin [Candidatus Competibacteraceae bacterium]|nr:type II toxin-antitoxin system RelE/ParE family toxin [Candidatus Competibacteraceae bacterium]